MIDQVEVEIEGLPLVTGDDWAKAQKAPESELPSVDPDRYPTSRLMGLSVEADARREYARALAGKRMYEQGKVLAARLSEFVAFPLRYLVWDSSRREWIAVPNSQSLRPVSLKPELVDRITGWATRQDIAELMQEFEGYGAVARASRYSPAKRCSSGLRRKVLPHLQAFSRKSASRHL